MANITSIRNALKANLATISGFQTYDFAPDKPEPPCAIVQPDPAGFLFRETMGKGVVRFNFVVTVLVGHVVDDESQDKLDGYLATSGSGSIWAALEADLTLGGSASDSKVGVTAVRNYGGFTFNELVYLGAEFLVSVLAIGTN